MLLLFCSKLYKKDLSEVKDNIVTNMGDIFLLPVKVREGDGRPGPCVTLGVCPIRL
jgi:hypothetical protein